MSNDTPFKPVYETALDDYNAMVSSGSKASASPTFYQQPSSAPDGAYQLASDKSGDSEGYKGFMRSFAEIPGLVAGTGAYLADIVGADNARDAMLKYAKDSNQSSQDKYGSDAASFTNVLKGKASPVDFVKNASGYVTGQALQFLMTGGIGAGVARGLLKGGAVAAADKLVAAELAKGATEEAAKKTAADFMASEASRLGLKGATTAAGAQNFNMELGSIYPDAVDQAAEDKRDLDAGDKLRILGAAGAAAATDTAMERVNLGKVMGGGKGSTFVRRAASEIPASVLENAGTEGIQTGLERYGAGQNMNNADAWRDYIDSMAVGGVGGVQAGALASLHQAHVPPEMKPVADKAAEPNSPLSKAAMAGNAGALGQAAAATQTGNDQTQTGSADPISQRAQSVIDTLNSTDTLQKLRDLGPKMGAENLTDDFLYALQVARDPRNRPDVRQQAMDQVEQAMQWTQTGFTTPREQQQQPGTAVALRQNNAVGPVGQAQFFDPNTIDGQAVRVDNMIGGPKALTGPERGLTTQDTTKPAEQPAAPAQEATQNAQPASVAPSEQQNVSAPNSVVQAQRASSLDGMSEVQAPRVDIPAGAGPAILRKRSEVVKQLAQNGFETVQRDGSDFWMLNIKTGQKFKLDGPADAQLARKAISDRVNAVANTAAASPLNDLKAPTQAQIDAGNYKKSDVIDLNGMQIKVENPKDSVRRGVSPDGTPWETKMAHHYGEFQGTIGADGDKLDVFVGPRPDSNKVYVIDQLNKDGSFDEHKVMMGFTSEQAAREGYLANYEKGWTGLGAITEMTPEEFKSWANSRAAKKPASSVLENAAASEKEQFTEQEKAEHSGKGDFLYINDGSKRHKLRLVKPGELQKKASSERKGKYRELTQGEAKTLETVASLIGRRVVFFSPESGFKTDGFVNPSDPSTIYINRKTSINPLAVFGHEFFHTLRQTNPQAWDAISAVVATKVTSEQGFRKDRYGKEIAKQKGDAELSSDNGGELEELVSDLGGNLLKDHAFWGEVFAKINEDNGAEAKGVIAKLAAYIEHAITKLIKGLNQRGFAAESFVKDLDEVRSAFKDAMVKHMQDVGISQSSMAAEKLKAEQKIKKNESVQQPANESIKKDLSTSEAGKINVDAIPGATLDSGTLTVPTASRDQANTELERIGSQLRLSPVRETMEEREQAEREYLRVYEKHIGTKDWLKAPNGNDTKLSERQWVQVRTPSFKNWFGDWEKAHADGGVWATSLDVSKVVDENGEPLVVYHGTSRGGFTEFNTPGGKERGDLGIFTTPNLAMALTYKTSRGGEIELNHRATLLDLIDKGYEIHETDDAEFEVYAKDGYLDGTFPSRKQAEQYLLDQYADSDANEQGQSGYYALFVNIRKPEEVDFDGALWSGKREQPIYQLVDEDGDPTGESVYTEEDAQRQVDAGRAADYIEDDDIGMTTDSVVREAQRYGDGAIIRNVVDSGPGYSAYIDEPSDVFVALKPEQLKSANFNSGAYSINSDDLRYSPERQYKLDIEREEREKAKSARLSDEEQAAIDKDGKELSLSAKQIKALAEDARRIKKQFPTSKGWASLTVVGVELKTNEDGEPIAGSEKPKFQAIAYGFNVPPGMTRAPAKVDQAWLNKVSDKFESLITDIYDRANKGDKNAQIIVGHQTWYRNVAEVLRREYGGAGDLLADILGATSPNTPVDTNWRFSVEIMRRFMAGEFNDQLSKFAKFIDDGGDASKYPAADKIRQVSGKLYGMNSTNAMKALVDMWRVIEPGQAPKARNFALNLIGQSNMATIDVWAARMLRRAANMVRGADLPRIPPVAESGVSGVWNASGTKVTGAFGFGAEVMDKVSKELEKRGIKVTPPDLQAIAWFAEKELWGQKGWTTKTGEGGSFEENIAATPVERYLAGWSIQQGEKVPSEGTASLAQARVLSMLIGDDSVVSARVMPSRGLYGNSIENSFDTEWTATKGQHDPSMAMAEIAKIAKENDQLDIFVSKVVGPKEENPNARPGVEIYFKNAKALEEAMPMLKKFTGKGQDGFTMVVDPRATPNGVTGEQFIGVRLQYVPEISMRWDSQLRRKLLAPGGIERVISGKRQLLSDIAREVELMDGVAYSTMQDYDTVVVGKENYDEYIDRSFEGGDHAPRSEAWFGGSVRQAIEEAAARLRGDVRQDGAGGVSDAGSRLLGQVAASADSRSISESGRIRRSPERVDFESGQDQGPGGREEDGSLNGLPRDFTVDGLDIHASHWSPAEKVARLYMAEAGLPYSPPRQYVKVDPQRAMRIAAEYEKLKHDPQNQEVKAAYEALARETIAQFKAAIDSGLKVEFIDFAKQGDPYAASPRLMTEDVRMNNHMWVFSTRDGFGSDIAFDPVDNPLLAETEFEISGKKALVNDLFRVIHDYFGHVKEGVGFRADGEENTWRAHSAMFSPLAQRALTTETRGQNSWVNYGPHGESNRNSTAGDTHYADQKVGLLPLWVSEDGRGDGPGPNGGILKSPERPQFYSQLQRAIEGVPARLDNMSATAWKQWLTGNASKLGIKAEEIEWSGIKDYLDLQGKAKLSKADLSAYLGDSGVKVSEVQLGGAKDFSAMSDAELASEYERIRGYKPESYGEPMSREEILDELEGALDEDTETTKYGKYTLPGGENYRELLITLPSASSQGSRGLIKFSSEQDVDGFLTDVSAGGMEALDYGATEDLQGRRLWVEFNGVTQSDFIKFRQLASANNGTIEVHNDDSAPAYRSSHWDEPNVLAHIRVNDRTDVDGKRVLFVEELQSDWGQEGKKRGFRVTPQREAELRAIIAKSEAAGTDATQEQKQAWADAMNELQPETMGRKPAQAPFVGKTEGWLNLALKRIAMMAVEGGYDKVAFVNGEQSADRYDMSKQVDSIKWSPAGNDKNISIDLGSQYLMLHANQDGTITDVPDGSATNKSQYIGKGLNEVIGKELADKIVAEKSGTLSGDGLKVGGEGMKTFYDKLVPQAINKLLPKLGGEKLDDVTFGNLDGRFTIIDTKSGKQVGRYKTLEEANSFMRQAKSAQARGMEMWFDANNLQHALDNSKVTQPGFDVTDKMRDTVGEGVALFSPERPYFEDLSDLKVTSNYRLGDLLKTSKKLSWWDRTIGTQYNLAQKHPGFKRVFDAVQNFINDVSAYATRAADMAPTILPKLDSLKDIGKTPLSAEDVKALRDPIFGGTLKYARDEDGNIIETDDVDKAGTVFTNEELRDKFGLNERQIGLYREFRRAVNQSMSDMAVSDMLRYLGPDGEGVRQRALNAKNLDEATDIIVSHLDQLAEQNPKRAEVLEDSKRAIKEKAGQAIGMMSRGYAPLSRFGQYTVYATGEGVGDPIFFMFDNERDANARARELKEQYPDANIEQGTMSQEGYKLFSGVTPETLAMFGEALGLEESGSDVKSQAFQTMLKMAKGNRSAMKRMIERKGVSGFNEDVGRVLAGFVYSNARQTSTNLHAGDIARGVQAIDQREGDVKDAAIRLMEYVQNPREEAQALRGLLFTNFIGGSIASAMVNMTQPFTMTLPYLAQFDGITGASKRMAEAVRLVSSGIRNDPELKEALKKAEAEGVVSPQEVHQLMSQASGKGALQSGDGTKAGDAAAKVNNAMAKVGLAWGKVFSAAEQFNRRVTFIAAYKLARDQGMADPMGFAEKAIGETQGIFNKGNKPTWARGAVGSTLFTFKQYSIAYVEFLRRMWGNGPEGKKAVGLALAVLFLMSGAGGMPGADDLDDVIDGFMQRVLGRSFDSKQAKKEFFANILGQTGAEFVMSGLSGLPGVPIDVSGRMGLGNLVPGTGLLTKKRDYGRDYLELLGPAGALFTNVGTGVSDVAQGEFGKAAKAVAPQAVQNAIKAWDMATMGYYRDDKGRKVIDTDIWDAVAKGIGFQPNSVAQIQQATGVQSNLITQNKLREGEIADKWAAGRIERDQSKIDDAKQMLADWNRNNPESPIHIDPSQINKRVIEANKSKAQRIAATAPKQLRESVKKQLERVD